MLPGKNVLSWADEPKPLSVVFTPSEHHAVMNGESVERYLGRRKVVEVIYRARVHGGVCDRARHKPTHSRLKRAMCSMEV